MKIPGAIQLGILGLWTLFAALAVFAILNPPARMAMLYKLAVFLGFGLLNLFILGFWLYTAYAGSGDWKFALHQLPPTLIKVMVQTALPALVLLALNSLSRQLGEKALPHLYGIEFRPSAYWLPDFQVVLPSAVWLASLAILVICAGIAVIAWVDYGFTSPMGLGALAAMALVGGSWMWYFLLIGKLGPELAAKREAIAQAQSGTDLDRSALLSRYRKLVEYRLGTREWNALVFHRMADEPFGLAYRFPGFLIGVEQANRYLIGVPPGSNVTGQGKGKEGIGALLNDRRRTFVSHIVEFDDRDPGTRADSADPSHTGAAPRAEMVKTKMIYNIYESPDYENAFAKSFAQLDGLGEKLRAKLTAANGKPGAAPNPEGYSHILVYCMGWNTDQQESIRNYNSLMGFLAQAAGESPAGDSFRPLVIGMSWPAEWSYLKPLSYLSKAGDADETGLVWGSYLLKKVLKPLKLDFGIPLVLVGHSFGARVLTRAAASNPDWIAGVPGPAYAEETDTAKKEIDLFIGLQGAVSANRFVRTGPLTSGWWEGAPYADLVKQNTRFIFTWSKNDKANPVAAYVTGANHLGGEFGHEFCVQHLEQFWPVLYAGKGDKPRKRAWPYDSAGQTYDPEKGWGKVRYPAGKIFTMDVTSIVKDQPYGKGGGAHSDIYTPETGMLLWRSIEKFALGRMAETAD